MLRIPPYPHLRHVHLHRPSRAHGALFLLRNETVPNHCYLSLHFSRSSRGHNCPHFSNTMADNISEAFQKGVLYSDQEIYKFLKLPTSAAPLVLQSLSSLSVDDGSSSGIPFRAFMIDKDEITVMIPALHLERFQGDNVNCEVGPISYRLITFDVVLAPTLVGFMAAVTKALAAAKVSVLPFAAYSRDHIFVAEADFDIAMDALTSLREEKSANS